MASTLPIFIIMMRSCPASDSGLEKLVYTEISFSEKHSCLEISQNPKSIFENVISERQITWGSVYKLISKIGGEFDCMRYDQKGKF